MPPLLEFSIEQGDITQFPADLLALKYAQGLYGAERTVMSALAAAGIAETDLRPAPGESKLIETRGALPAAHALFVGTPPLTDIGYQNLRDLSIETLRFVGRDAPGTRHLAMTIHGPGFGLDEVESALAQFGGIMEVVEAGGLPDTLERITIVEFRADRVARVRTAFDKALVKIDLVERIPDRWAYRLGKATRPTLAAAPTGAAPAPARRSIEVDSAGAESEGKAYVFVAMPYAKELDDVFYYGIQGPAHTTGFLCERVDQEAFTGDILNRVKNRIESAAVVIAELTGANPNVYLEVGYAWGKGRPTILIAKSDNELKFDVRGQRCLTYERIRDLEGALGKELTELKAKGQV